MTTDTMTRPTTRRSSGATDSARTGRRTRSWMSDDELAVEERLLCDAAAGDQQAQRAMLDRYAPLLGAMARRVGRGDDAVVDVDDLVAVGQAVMLAELPSVLADDAVDRPFGYLVTIVRNAMVDHLRANDPLSRGARQRARAARAARAQLEQQEGREVPLSAGAAVVGASAQDLLFSHRVETLGSLDAPLGPDGWTQLDRLAAVEHEVDRYDGLGAAISMLSDREREVVVHTIVEERRADELAERWDVSPSRISQLKRRALRRMREQLEAQMTGALG